MVSLHHPNTILRHDIDRNNLSSNHNRRLVNTPTPTQKTVIPLFLSTVDVSVTISWVTDSCRHLQ